MTNPIFIILILAILISILGSILIVVFVWKRKNKKDKNQKNFLIWIFLILFGSLFVCIGVSCMVYLQNRTQGWEEIPAVISSVERYRYNSKKTSLIVHVDYKYKAKEYKDRNLNYQSTDMYKGQEVTILVNPKEPDEFEFNLQSQNRLFYLFIGLGSIFIIFSLYQCFREATGRAIEPQVTSASGQDAPETEENFIKRNMFPILVIIGMFTFIYTIVPFPIFVFMVLWFFGGFIFFKIKKRK